MKRVFCAGMAVLLTIHFWACRPQNETTTGEVFLVEGLGVSTKLGLATVAAYDFSEMASHIDAQRRIAERNISTLALVSKQATMLTAQTVGPEKLESLAHLSSATTDAIDYFHSAQFYFEVAFPDLCASPKQTRRARPTNHPCGPARSDWRNHVLPGNESVSLLAGGSKGIGEVFHYPTTTWLVRRVNFRS